MIEKIPFMLALEACHTFIQQTTSLDSIAPLCRLSADCDQKFSRSRVATLLE